MKIRQIPHRAALHDVSRSTSESGSARAGVDGELIAEQFLSVGLIRASNVRPVGAVIEPRRDACLVVQLNGVVEAELQSVLEAAIERELQRVIGAPSFVEPA